MSSASTVPQLLSTLEVARILDITVPTVLGFVRDGSLRASLIATKFRYTHEALNEFVTNNVSNKRSR